jgi:toxin ParE1/3/4
MRIQFSRAAQTDIQSIFDFISKESPIAAKRLVAEIELATSRLTDFPLSGRNGAVDGTRELVIPRTPYIAVYLVSEDVVVIIAVFHAAQDKPRGY